MRLGQAAPGSTFLFSATVTFIPTGVDPEEYLAALRPPPRQGTGLPQIEGGPPHFATGCSLRSRRPPSTPPQRSEVEGTVSLGDASDPRGSRERNPMPNILTSAPGRVHANMTYIKIAFEWQGEEAIP